MGLKSRSASGLHLARYKRAYRKLKKAAKETVTSDDPFRFAELRLAALKFAKTHNDLA